MPAMRSTPRRTRRTGTMTATTFRAPAQARRSPQGHRAGEEGTRAGSDERAEEEQAARRENAEAEGREFKARKDPKDAKPSPQAQRNFTDHESRIMLSGKAVVQGYNTQIAVDGEHQVIVATDLTNQAADAPHLPGLMNQMHANTGAYPQRCRPMPGTTARRTSMPSRGPAPRRWWRPAGSRTTSGETRRPRGAAFRTASPGGNA